MFHAPWEALWVLPPYDVHAPSKKFGPYVLYFTSIFDFGSQGGLTALLPMMSMRHLKSACRASCTLHPFWIPGSLGRFAPYDVHAPPENCGPCLLHSTFILDFGPPSKPYPHMMSMHHLKSLGSLLYYASNLNAQKALLAPFMMSMHHLKSSGFLCNPFLFFILDPGEAVPLYALPPYDIHAPPRKLWVPFGILLPFWIPGRLYFTS